MDPSTEKDVCLSSLDGLPVELMADVFNRCMSSVPLGIYYPTLLHLTLVSRRIHSIIHNTPSLLTVVHTGRDSFQQITKTISKSKGEPLIINIATNPQKTDIPVYLDPFIDLLLAHSNRWSCLSIETWHDGLHNIRAPQLKHLHLNITEPLRLFGSFPGLTDVTSLGGWPLDRLSIPGLMRLRRLEILNLNREIASISYDDFRSLLCGNPGLEILRFEYNLSASSPLDKNGHPILLPRLQTLVVNVLDNRFSISLVRELLKVNFGPSLEFTPFTHLRCLVLEGWETVALKVEELLRVLQSNQGLETFQFGGTISGRHRAFKAVALPCLRTFILDTEEEWMMLRLAKLINAEKCRVVKLQFRNGRLGAHAPDAYPVTDLDATLLKPLLKRLDSYPIEVVLQGIDFTVSIGCGGDEVVSLVFVTDEHVQILDWVLSKYSGSWVHLHLILEQVMDFPGNKFPKPRRLFRIERLSITSSDVAEWFLDLRRWPLPDLSILTIDLRGSKSSINQDLRVFAEKVGTFYKVYNPEEDSDTSKTESSSETESSSSAEDWEISSDDLEWCDRPERLLYLEIRGRSVVSSANVALLQKVLRPETKIVLPDGTSVYGLKFDTPTSSEGEAGECVESDVDDPSEEEEG